jgi:oxygen-independent coproporphyrinogen III oxidase
MCNLQLNWKNLAGGLKIREEDLRRIIKPDKQTFNEFVKDGLIELTDENIQVTKMGTLYIRNIAAAIDPAYRQQNKKYSTTV